MLDAEQVVVDDALDQVEQPPTGQEQPEQAAAGPERLGSLPEAPEDG
jgi:hypothetical protein